MDRFDPGVRCHMLQGERDEEEEEGMRWIVFGEDSHIKVAKCDLWRDPENVPKGAIAPHERCSALISPDKMLHIKGEERGACRISYFPSNVLMFPFEARLTFSGDHIIMPQGKCEM